MVKKVSSRKAITGLNQMPISPIDALLKKLDMVACEMETRWGHGVLNTLCKPDTSAKFIRVKDALDIAIKSGDYDLVKAKSESLIKGWQLMEKETIEAGHKAQPTEIWYVTSPKEGIEYIVCRHELDATRMTAMFPSKASVIYTMQHIAKMLEDGSMALFAPKKELDYFTKKVSEVGKIIGDEIPF